MPAITRNGIDPSAGHCFPPVITVSSGQNTGLPTVFVNTVLATVVGAQYESHCCSCDGDDHAGVAGSGSGTVFIQNLPVHRIGDGINCGDVSASGSPNVFSGG